MTKGTMAVMSSLKSLLLLSVAAAAASSDAAAEGVCGAADCRGDHVLMQLKHTKAKHAKVRQHRLGHGQLGYQGTGQFVTEGEWCKGEEPAASWTLENCDGDGSEPLEVKMLTYNLFWWNLYGLQKGNGGSAGKVIADGQKEDGATVHYDMMVFQECDDVHTILQDAKDHGLSGVYETLVGDHALGIAYRSSSWSLLDHGSDDVAEDQDIQWYGNRGAQWARLQHKATKKSVLVANHHGPLPVGTGGKCGGKATAWNILKTIATHAHEGDAVVLAGDFNAGNSSETVAELDQRLHRVFTGVSFGGIDHIYSSSCTGSGRRLELGGSDHEALDAKISV